MLFRSVAALNYDMVWFGILVAITMQTAYLSPPVAMSAYYLKQVVREWSLSTIYRGMADFMVIQCLAVVLVLSFPAIAMWLPQTLSAQARADRVIENEADRKAADGKPEEKVDSLEAGDNLPQAEPKAEADKGDSLEKGDNMAPMPKAEAAK